MTGFLKQAARFYLLLSLAVAVPLPVMAGMPAPADDNATLSASAGHDRACASHEQDAHQCCEQACPSQCDMCASFVTGALLVHVRAEIVPGPDTLSAEGHAIPTHLDSRPYLRPPRPAA